MKHLKILGLVLTLLLGALPALWAQTPEKGCGTVVTEEQIRAELDRAEKGPGLAVAPPVNRPFWIPLTIHIVRRSSGTDGFTLAQLDIAMQDLNRLWQPVGMQFFQYGAVDYINSDFHFQVPDVRARQDQLRQVNPVAD